jgi:hypothetical protein
MSLADVEALLAPGAFALRRVPPRWVWCTVDGLGIGEVGFTVVLGFEDDALHSIRLSDRAYASSSWDDWSEENELRRKKAHDAWLSSTLGAPPYDCAWGSISSLYDVRGGSASIVVTYGARGG